MKWTQKNKYLLLIIISVAGFSLDWFTKYMAVYYLREHHIVNVFGDLLSFYLTYNKYAVFGINLGQWLPGFPLNGFHIAFSCLAVILLIFYYRSVTRDDAPLLWGLALIMPGALGNVLERAMFPHRGVVDFILLDLNVWPANPWPIFNFADIYVTAGVCLILLSMIREAWDERKNAPKAE